MMTRAFRHARYRVLWSGGIMLTLSALLCAAPFAFATTQILHHKDWQVRVIVDDFTDESRVILNTKVEENEEDFAGKRGIVLIRSDVSSQTVSTVTDMLVIKCDSPGDLPYVVIATQKEVAEAGMRNIEFRVDKRDTKRVLMTSHQKYLMIFDRRKARRFIEQIRSGHLLIGRSRPINGKRIEFRIPIDGFDEVEHHLFEHCSRQ